MSHLSNCIRKVRADGKIDHWSAKYNSYIYPKIGDVVWSVKQNKYGQLVQYGYEKSLNRNGYPWCIGSVSSIETGVLRLNITLVHLVTHDSSNLGYQYSTDEM